MTRVSAHSRCGSFAPCRRAVPAASAADSAVAAVAAAALDGEVLVRRCTAAVPTSPTVPVAVPSEVAVALFTDAATVGRTTTATAAPAVTFPTAPWQSSRTTNCPTAIIRKKSQRWNQSGGRSHVCLFLWTVDEPLPPHPLLSQSNACALGPVSVLKVWKARCCHARVGQTMGSDRARWWTWGCDGE